MSDVTLSGKVKYGVTLGPNGGTTPADELTSTEKTEARLTVTATPDDNNTVTLTLKLDNAGAAGPSVTGTDADLDGDLDAASDITWDAGSAEVGVDVAKYESNLLSAFGLGDIPVSVVLTGGYFEWANADVGKFTGYEVEDVINTKNKEWQFQVDVGIMDMVTVRVGIDPTWQYQPTGAVGNADSNNIGFVMGAFGGAGPVMAEIFYTNVGDDIPAEEPGDLGIGVGVTLGFGDIGINIGANALLPLAEGTDHVANLGFGVKFTYASLLSAGVGMYGFIADEDVLGTDSSSVANLLAINVDVTPIDLITIFAGMKIGLDSDAYDDAFRLLDVGLKTTAGALELGIGYQYRPDSAADDQGKEDLYAYTTNNEEGGVFINTTVSF
jgi:hypothetical protein